MLIDYHVHTRYSYDSYAQPSDMLDEAIKKGISEICFTEHYDIDPLNRPEVIPPRIGEYCIGGFNRPIKIKKGLELGVEPGLEDFFDKLVLDRPYDFIILSKHFIGDDDPYLPDFFIKNSRQDAYSLYEAEMFVTARNMKNYSVVGHIGYPSRYDSEGNFPYNMDTMSELFRMLIHNGKGVEINSRGAVRGETFPEKRLLMRYKELGGEIITFGSDAHTPNQVGAGIAESVELARSIGFSYFCTYDKLKPTFHPLG